MQTLGTSLYLIVLNLISNMHNIDSLQVNIEDIFDLSNV